MSVLPLKADIRHREWHVRYVPIADIVNLMSMLTARVTRNMTLRIIVLSTCRRALRAPKRSAPEKRRQNRKRL
jgi:hypothetical protein